MLIKDAINNCECIPFGTGSTIQEAYENCYRKYLKYFHNGYWLVDKYSYFDFFKISDEIDGYIDFLNKSESEYAFFDKLKDIQKNINLDLLNEDD